MPTSNSIIVSSEDERLILVDGDDNETGFLSKAECHDGPGILHRAFSVFLFNCEGDLLLQQRATGKRLWPEFWSNTCCSHPREGESVEFAVARRLEDELQARAETEFVYRFTYQASFGELGSEHEMCHVYLGRVGNEPRANVTEIDALRYVSATALDREFAESPEHFTPWFKLEWRHLNEEHGDVLQRYTNPANAARDR